MAKNKQIDAGQLSLFGEAVGLDPEAMPEGVSELDPRELANSRKIFHALPNSLPLNEIKIPSLPKSPIFTSSQHFKLFRGDRNPRPFVFWMSF